MPVAGDKIPAIQRFLPKVEKASSGCWLWLGCKDKDGYGFIRIDGKNIKTHRFAYQHFVGEIGLLQVLHRCDAPSCVNPAHLFIGTNSDNQIDAARKGRQGSQRLTSDNVRDIRQSYGMGVTQASLGKLYGLSAGYVSHIITRRKWAHVD